MPSVDDLDWGRDESTDALDALVEPAPFTLRSPELDLQLEFEWVAGVGVEDTPRAPREMMHIATCEGESCQSCGAYGDRMCSLLYGV